MLRITLTSIAILALLSAHPASAKNEGNGGGNGGGNGNGNAGGGNGNGNGGGNGNSGGGRGEGNGNGGGGRGEGTGQGNGNGGGQDQGNGGGNGNSRGGGEKGERGGQDGGSSNGAGQGNGGVGGGGGKGDGSGRSGGGAEGRGSQGNSPSGGSSGGAGSPDTGRGRGGSASAGGYDGWEAGSVSPQAAPSARSAGPAPEVTASFATRESAAELSLPSSLIPRLESSGSNRADSMDMRTTRAGVSGQLVELCRTSIAEAALRYGAIRVDAAGAGPTSRLPGGGLVAPLHVRVVYARANARQVRQSRVACRLNAAGSVVALR